jgi:predicted AAA+ superfamily ATPase
MAKPRWSWAIKLGNKSKYSCKIEMSFCNTNMIKRKYFDLLNERLGKYPAVALVRPRQAGKTTLAKSLGGQYFDLE